MIQQIQKDISVAAFFKRPVNKMMNMYDDDEDEDDEDLIVFKEKQAPGFSLSQLTQKHSQHSQSQESFPTHQPSRMISRQERRKRRNEWKERQLQDQQQFNSAEFTAPETEDAFESLKSLLPDSPNMRLAPKTVETQKGKTEKENNTTAKKPRKINGNDSQIKEGSKLDDGANSPNPTNTPNVTNDHREKQERQSIDKSFPKEENVTGEFNSVDFCQETIANYAEQRPEKPKPRSRKQRSRSPEKVGFDSELEASSPVRPSKKRRKSRDCTSKHIKSASQRHQSTQSKRKSLKHLTPWSNSQSQTITPTQRVKKSIVGTRPSTWKKEPEKPLEWKVSQKLSKTSSSKSPQLAAKKAPNLSQIRAKYMPQPHRTRKTALSTTKRTTATTAITPCTTSSRSKGGRDQCKSPVSFTPSFLPTRSRRNEDDEVEEVPEKPLRRGVVNATSPLHPTSPLLRDAQLLASPIPRSKRRTKKTIGPWQRRLEALQSSRSNDAIRLQNEAFRRQRKSFEMNDYRKKSKSHTDITILGDCNASLRQNSGKQTQDSSKICVLAYIHSHVQNHQEQEKQPHANTNATEEKPTLQHQLAWATFTFLTARSINLQKGKQLRLYNSIILPCPLSTAVEGMSIDAPLESKVCEHIIVSTWLCENHPKGLPKMSFGSSSKKVTEPGSSEDRGLLVM